MTVWDLDLDVDSTLAVAGILAGLVIVGLVALLWPDREEWPR